MVDDMVLHRTAHSYAVPALMGGARVVHTILWKEQGGLILPMEVSGRGEFIDASKSYTFSPGEGYVGRIYGQRGVIHVEILEDIFSVDPRLFLRKSAALLGNVWSILFLNKQDGLLELGFDHPHAARDAKSSLVLNNLVLKSLGTFQKRTSVLGKSYGMPMCHDLPDCMAGPDHPFDQIQSLSPKQPFAESLPSAGMPMCHDLPDCKAGLDHPFDQIQSLSPKQPFADSLPSAGSAGHPHCCGQPCKYARIKRGCKDGAKCTRCHICRFARYGRRR